VGDRFHLPAGNYYDPISGTTNPTPEKNATVTAMSMLGVTCEVDGEPMTVSREAFVMLAKNTMAHGAKLTRGHTPDISHGRQPVNDDRIHQPMPPGCLPLAEWSC
jgi:hypothetical protein